MSTDNIKHKELTEIIIGSSMKILNEIKPGLDEKLYERALVIEIMENGIRIEQQKSYKVYYRNQEIGKLIPDLIVDNKVIVDTKTVTAFNESHIAQILGYLSITGLEVGILINFKYAKLQWKRIVL